MQRTQQLLTALVTSYTQVLGSNLVGIYLHGSYVLGSYNEDVSDLDYVVVVHHALTATNKRELMSVTLQKLWPLAPKKGLEFHVLVQAALRPFEALIPFDFHFSKYHYQNYLQAPDQYIQTMHGTDPDLAAHLTILNHYGQVLTGPAIAAVFSPIPPAVYWQALVFDIADAQAEITVDPVYVTLNLCRVLAYQRSGLILSKNGGGRWGLDHLALRWRPLIDAALQTYNGKPASGRIDSSDLTDFATMVLTTIL
ncbi:aminoglycoside adenylyltransferase domain-containing protein [Lactiplantibacillus plajomi]|uniref:Aminoglycoside adenylyltransferase domain-containing protein n=1 Tax=Lactiplantibacillus plajomi TaxID=1457217 RepID=A0ABV6K1D0_9LACO|nr:aminoglycoside adenylyltransferase domain-containing protein [Lactiplantibacillus plajomi]